MSTLYLSIDSVSLSHSFLFLVLLPVSQCVFLSKGTVSVLLTRGMVVHLSDHVKGLVPRTHLSDIILKNPEKKYMEGMKIKCRVSPILYFISAKKHEICSCLVQLIKSFADFLVI